jgi:hypothetical protein
MQNILYIESKKVWIQVLLVTTYLLKGLIKCELLLRAPIYLLVKYRPLYLSFICALVIKQNNVYYIFKALAPI